MSTARYAPACQAVVSGAGAASAVLVPTVRTGQTVSIHRVTVTSSDVLDMGEARLYRNSAVPGNFIDGTASAAQDLADYSSPVQLVTGESLIVVWTGCTAGATVTANAEGTVTGGF